MARRATVTFLSVHEIQRQHKQQHVYRVKGVAGILERFENTGKVVLIVK